MKTDFSDGLFNDVEFVIPRTCQGSIVPEGKTILVPEILTSP
jgi:hypothetical protein